MPARCSSTVTNRPRRVQYPLAELSTFSTGELSLQGLINEPDLVVLDYHLDSVNPTAMNGLQVLKKLKLRFPFVPVIFLSGQEKAELAYNTIKYGAWDYILKNEIHYNI